MHRISPPNGSFPLRLRTLAPDRGADSERLSEALARWLEGEGEKTVGSLIELFQEKSFAILFVILLGVPALPAPTGGVTHVFEAIAALLALQLIAGRNEIWLPERWRARQLAGDKQERFLAALMKMIRWLERVSKPRLRFLFNHRLSNSHLRFARIGRLRWRVPCAAVHRPRHPSGPWCGRPVHGGPAGGLRCGDRGSDNRSGGRRPRGHPR